MSGSVIIGVSLGAERVLRLEKDKLNSDSEIGEEGGNGWDIKLGCGDLYLQR